MILYRIKDWQAIYENNRTRDLKRMDWLPVPNSHDGEGYTLTATQDDGPQLVGAWLVILQVASKCELPAVSCDNPAPPCERRGTLIRDTGKPHDAASISRITRFPVAVIERALKWFTSDEMQWMEIVDEQGTLQIPQSGAAIPQPPATAPQPPAVLTRTRSGNGTEGKGTGACVEELPPGAPCSLKQALAAAETYGITPAEADFWWHSRASDDWMKGGKENRRAIGGGWGHDMKQFTLAVRQREGDRQESGAARPKTKADEPAWAIRRELRDVEKELDGVESFRVGQWGNLPPDKAAQKKLLQAHKRTLLENLKKAEQTQT